MKSIFKLLYEADVPLEDYVIGASDAEITVKKPSSDSVDYQIDQFLIGYERDAIAAADEGDMFESLETSSLEYLFEQDEDPFAEDDEDPFADDTGGDEAEGEEGEEAGESEEVPDEEVPDDAANIKANEPAALPTPKMNMSVFVSNVNRLLANYDSLLDTRTVVVNRAKNYLEQNYGELHVSKFEEIINQDGRLNITQDQRVELEDEPFQVGAYAGGTGGLGGGGGA